MDKGVKVDKEVVLFDIHLWLQEQLVISGAKGFVVGMSGGIDSSVVAALCKKTESNTLGIFMPCGFTPEDAFEDAKEVANKFNIEFLFRSLDKSYREMILSLGVLEENPDEDGMHVANIKPRLRMITLYYFANKNNFLVAGTGNKTEEVLGYFTKYGDGGVDILPIGDFLKTEVKELARFLDIPERIITKPPTAGLWEGQTDEKEIGMSYENIDKILTKMENSEHKRNTPPTFMHFE